MSIDHESRGCFGIVKHGQCHRVQARHTLGSLADLRIESIHSIASGSKHDLVAKPNGKFALISAPDVIASRFNASWEVFPIELSQGPDGTKGWVRLTGADLNRIAHQAPMAHKAGFA